MISYDRYLAILAESDAAVRQGADAAFVKLLEKIRAGAKPRAALDAVLKEFNADAIVGFREALNALLQSSLGNAEVKAYKVGRVKLSDALYANAQAVAGVSQQIIEKHMAGVHTARELRKALYEGYDFQQDPLNIVKPLPKYLQVEFDKFKAAALKTPALRAAYLEAIRKAEAGAGMDALEKALKVAFYERNRYFANRIARTELHRNYTDKVAKELMEEEQIEYVQFRMSSTHPKADQCDAMAKVDRYGLGPGVFPKADAPKPPLHPHCRCVVSPKIDIFNAKPRFNPKAEQAFLAKLPPKEARDIAGSWDKLKRAKGGETLEAIYNEGKDPLYRWQRMGERVEQFGPGIPIQERVRQNAPMNEPDRLEPAPPRRVASPLLDQHEVAATISDEFRATLEQTLAQLPTVLVQRIKDSGYRLRFGTTLLEMRPDLKGKTPRGWRPGSTFEHVDGLHDPDEQQICIFEYFKSDLTATSYTKNTRAAGVFRHEIGHLLDRLFGGLSDQERFRTAYERDLEYLFSQEDLFDECSYYVQDGIAGRKEAFAELFAILMGGGAAQNAPVKAAFANALAALRDELEGLR